ncbi:MAG: fimbrial protein [Prevotella sp.]|nr:fimbrial protein [Prevotella sp.]
MKKIGWINILFSIFLVTLAACTDDDGQDSSWHGKEMRVNLRVSVPAWTENTRAGSASVEEGINDFQLLCFDKDGYFVGRRAVTFTSSQGTPSGGTLTGTVPSTTCRIHFIANGDFSSFNDTQSMGVNENTVVSALDLSNRRSADDLLGLQAFFYPRRDGGIPGCRHECGVPAP